MPIMLNSLLKEAGLSLSDVRLLRHQDNRAQKGRSPYELWRGGRTAFDAYQSIQSIRNRVKLRANYWASFVALPDARTLFVGVYRSTYLRPLAEDRPQIHAEGVDRAGTCDDYELTLEDFLGDLVGKLLISWGAGARAWIQRPEKQNKAVTELLREFKEPDFPGFLSFVTNLSTVKAEALPQSWKEILRVSRGIYLLTCPKTREQYVGKTSGQDGFWGRWQCHAATGYGDAIKLKSRGTSDYQVSILEVVGTAASDDEIYKIEEKWKRKLQSREMGLNAN